MTVRLDVAEMRAIEREQQRLQPIKLSKSELVAIALLRWSVRQRRLNNGRS
jgi:hypothetical protein